MLKPDDARRELAKVSSNQHLKDRLARLQKLPKAAAAVGLGMFKLLPTGKKPSGWSESYGLQNRSLSAIGANAKLRRQVLVALYPTFWKEIEQALEVMARLPYPTGFNRRPYRALSRPELFAGKIGAYLGAVNDALSNVTDDALTPEWVASWAVHLHHANAGLGYLFAGQIDAGRDDILEILKDSAANRHAIGGPGAHAVRGLLCCEQPAAWEFVANLLLAAQRQEGLRQVILEAADEAHPKAFRLLLGITLDQNLIRFAAAARAAGVWLGEQLMVEDAKALEAALSTVRDFLDTPASRAKALKSGDANALYRALWTLAFEDVTKAIATAKPILKDKIVGRRIAAIKLLGETSLLEVADAVLPMLEDKDPRVLSATISFFASFKPADWDLHKELKENSTVTHHPAKLFEKLEKTLPLLPEKPQAVQSPVTTWPLAPVSQEAAANLLVDCLQDRPAERLLPWMKMMSASKRAHSLAKLCEPRTLTTKVRATLLACAAETNTLVREAALNHLKKSKLAEDEVRTLEGLLRRKQPDLRRGVFGLLLNRPDKLALQSIERLLPGDPLERAGGIELARQMAEAKRGSGRVSELLSAFLAEKDAKLSEPEREAIDRILHPAAVPPTLADGLGLFDPKDRSLIVKPRQLEVKINSLAATAFLRELDALVYANRDRTFTKRNHLGRGDEVILGSVRYRWDFPSPDEDKTLEQNIESLPLLELWQDWYANRPSAMRDADGLELVRAALTWTTPIRDGDRIDVDRTEALDPATAKAIRDLYPEPPAGLRHESVVKPLLEWFLLLHCPRNGIDFFLDALEQSFAAVPASLHEKLPRITGDAIEATVLAEKHDWRKSAYFSCGQVQAAWFKRMPHWTAEHSARMYRLLRWKEEPLAGTMPDRVHLNDLLRGYEAGAARLADFYDHLIGQRAEKRNSYSITNNFDSLWALTGGRSRRRHDRAASLVFERCPELQEGVQRVVSRIVEIEINRGETPTVASRAVSAIQRIHGVESVFPLIAAIGKAAYKTSYWHSGKNKPESLTKLISVVTPAKTDTPELFAQTVEPWLRSGKISHEKIVALGLLNTRLVKHVAQVLQWPGYEEACYWFMAHANSSHATALQHSNSDHEDEQQRAWRATVKARSNLTAEQRADGVVDVDWFHKAYAALASDEHWDAIEKAARFLGYGYAEKRAARLADVLLGRTAKKVLVESIEKKFLKESVRLLGLLPLPQGPKKVGAELADRYRVLKNYERYARGLSSLSKEPALQSFRLGMENLAVTAGYPDPVRLEWAVTSQEVADLAKGPATMMVKDITVSLRLGAFAEPEITATQAGKPLKSLSKELRVDTKVQDLLDRKKNIARLASSTKRTLEQAMCNGSRFEPAELAPLLEHAIVRPALQCLVLRTDSGLGYPVSGGHALQCADGKTIPLKGSWSIANPLDFVAAGNWHQFQSECFQSERIQPFKQVFREVYTLTPAEKEDVDKSRRYSGQQVNENQAKALLSGRGWSTKEDLSKLYRAEGIVVELFLEHGYTTPGDAAAPAVHELRFFKRGDWKPLALADVPPMIFSEVMRDLDLVVSVAHVGGVDPEATQSTIAMRSSLLAETCSLLRMANVKLESKHALIKGEYGRYSVHLGSGVVHKQPGGALCVVAVNSQHRGRLFLPFADDDPRTAEIVSKVLLLARDKEIQDPTILEQIVGV